MVGDFDVSDLPDLSEHDVAKILQKQKSQKGSSEYILDSGKWEKKVMIFKCLNKKCGKF